MNTRDLKRELQKAIDKRSEGQRLDAITCYALIGILEALKEQNLVLEDIRVVIENRSPHAPLSR